MKSMKKDNYRLKIGWLYPDLMSTYGDRGNIIVLKKRCEWRGVDCEVIGLSSEVEASEMTRVDLIFGGGAQDREQEIVMRDLSGAKGRVLKGLIERGIPGVFVCGAPQLLGNFYEPAEGKRIEGLGIFDMETRHPGRDKPRLIGNIAVELTSDGLNFGFGDGVSGKNSNKIVVGFENHGGRTYLGKNAKPFARVIRGFGNNGRDRTEGVVYKNAIGTYLHGPLLPKNPFIADYLIKVALEVKYKDKIELTALDDELEKKAREAVLKRLGL